MAPHSSTLAWKIPWTEDFPSRQQAAVHGVTKSWTRLSKQLHFHFSLACIGEGNGNPLQCSCLENPKDGGAQWAAVYGVAQSRTRLKQLSSSSSSSSSIYQIMVLYHFIVPEFDNIHDYVGFPGGQTVKNLPAMQDTQVQSLGCEDPLEKGMATQSSILAWRISWTE